MMANAAIMASSFLRAWKIDKNVKMIKNYFVILRIVINIIDKQLGTMFLHFLLICKYSLVSKYVIGLQLT